jgi:hypothetical protein
MRAIAARRSTICARSPVTCAGGGYRCRGGGSPGRMGTVGVGGRRVRTLADGAVRLCSADLTTYTSEALPAGTT